MTQWAPINSGDIKDKWIQLEDLKEPLTLIHWSGLMTLLLRWPYVCGNRWLENCIS
jgi:hypothetical protein